jgi:hypothetical protein
LDAARRPVVARVAEIHDTARCARRHRIEQASIHDDALAGDGCGVRPSFARATLLGRWKVEDPVSRCFVLPWTRFTQVAHDGYGSGPTHALRGLRALREADHLMATGQEDLDQLEADESCGSCHKRGRPRVACHVASVESQRACDHGQDPHRTRTTGVRVGAARSKGDKTGRW